MRQDGNTALIKAAEAGNPDIVQQLLEHGADLDHVDKVSAATGSFADYPDGVVCLDTVCDTTWRA